MRDDLLSLPYLFLSFATQSKRLTKSKTRAPLTQTSSQSRSRPLSLTFDPVRNQGSSNVLFLSLSISISIHDPIFSLIDSCSKRRAAGSLALSPFPTPLLLQCLLHLPHYGRHQKLIPSTTKRDRSPLSILSTYTDESSSYHGGASS